MKNLLFIAAIFCLLQRSAGAQTLNVHEWGTFTTLHGSAGGTLSGLYYEEEQLPPFVYHFLGFAPDSNLANTGYRPCSNVTVKMETPVLYFYSNAERQVQVHVDFPTGTISQWYPNRSGGEETPVGRMDFSEQRTGSIDWNATVLSPSTTEKLTQQNVSAFHKWTDPRGTTSNLIKNNNGEIEKYLFYRGVANFPLPVAVQFIDSVHLSVSNTSALDLPFIYIYDHTSSGSAGIWGIGPLKAGETKIFMPGRFYGEDAYIPQNDSFKLALQNAGLTKLEAQAMLKTWQDGYFQTLGFKIFWIVPRHLTDQILPIKITPTPDTLERVLVGKTEILTPKFEAKLLADYRAGRMSNYTNDRYHLAYLQRAQELQAAYDAAPKPLTVHELGTFTTLHGSTGGSLSGLYLEDETTPAFLYHFSGFSPDLLLTPCTNVTVKLENPLMYFYSAVQKQIQVHIDLPTGSIPQWYPNRASGEITPSVDTMDFSQNRRGSIEWNATVLSKNSEEKITEINNVNYKWESSRTTDANLVKNEVGETEKSLHYNGLANFDLPLEIKFIDSNSISVTNTSQLDIPFIYIYDNSYYPVVCGAGPLLHNSTRFFYKGSLGGANGYYEFNQAVESAGLTQKETDVLISESWDNYSTQGSTFKVFWIVPLQLTDQILPVWMNPWPDTLQRVFLGKTEILAPSFEKQLLDYYTKNGNLDQWRSDKYHLAYLERVKQLYKPITASVSDPKSMEGILISPNPASTIVHIHSDIEIISAQVYNLLGELVLTQKNLQTPNFTLDLSKLVAGTYYIRFSSANSVVTKKIIKN